MFILPFSINSKIEYHKQFPSMPLKGTNYVIMTIGDIFSENGKTKEVRILVSNLKYVVRITRMQAQVVAKKEKERKETERVILSDDDVDDVNHDESAGFQLSRFEMTDSGEEESDEKFI